MRIEIQLGKLETQNFFFFVKYILKEYGAESIYLEESGLCAVTQRRSLIGF
jgi:hypothetical protein